MALVHELFDTPSYIVEYTIRNFVLPRRVSGAMKYDFGRIYMYDDEQIEYGYRHSSVHFTFIRRKHIILLQMFAITAMKSQR